MNGLDITGFTLPKQNTTTVADLEQKYLIQERGMATLVAELKREIKSLRHCSLQYSKGIIVMLSGLN